MFAPRQSNWSSGILRDIGVVSPLNWVNNTRQNFVISIRYRSKDPVNVLHYGPEFSARRETQVVVAISAVLTANSLISEAPLISAPCNSAHPM